MDVYNHLCSNGKNKKRSKKSYLYVPKNHLTSWNWIGLNNNNINACQWTNDYGGIHKQ